jgi:hypothetical protein
MTAADVQLERWNNRHSKPELNRVAEQVLDLLLAERYIMGEIRPEHRLKWVSALHCLTERLIGVRQLSFSHPNPYHHLYCKVADALLMLESTGLVRMYRNQGSNPQQGNVVYRIEVIS